MEDALSASPGDFGKVGLHNVQNGDTCAQGGTLTIKTRQDQVGHRQWQSWTLSTALVLLAPRLFPMEHLCGPEPGENSVVARLQAVLCPSCRCVLPQH